MKPYRFSLLLVLLVLIPWQGQAQQDLLRSFFDKLERNTLQASFVLTVTDQATQPMSFTGTLQMQGERFYLTMNDMEIAFDGQTMYSYSSATDELTLTTPTEQDKLESNPLLFAKALQKESRQEWLNNKADATLCRIAFIPNNTQAGIRKIVLTLRRADLVPLEVKIQESATSQTVLKLNNAHYVASEGHYTLLKPKATLNDLR